MDFGLTAEQAALRERVETFCSAHCTEEHAAALDRESRYPVTAHVTTREQFGQPVSRFQAVQHQLADIATEIDAMELLTYRAAWMAAQGMARPKEISMAKLYCSERLSEIVLRGMRLLGGGAYFTETPMPRRVREAVLALYAGGTVEIQRNTIAKSLGL